MKYNSDRLSHAYITGSGLASELAMAVVCSGQGNKPCMSCAHCDKSARGIHPDIVNIKKYDGKREILIEQIRELKKDVIVVPNEADRKAYIIEDASSMNANAQNALLRILEEPPSHTVFILKTDTPDELLRTVRSRCTLLKAKPGEPVIDNAAVAAADNAVRKSDGRSAGKAKAKTLDKSGDNAADTMVSDIARGFLAATRDSNVKLMEYMFKLEKLDKLQLAEFLFTAREFAAASLRSSAPQADDAARVALARVERVLHKAEGFLDLNVSSGHISGMICAELLMRSAEQKV